MSHRIPDFEFVRLTQAGEDRQRMTVNAPDGIVYRLLFVSGHIAQVIKLFTQTRTTPYKGLPEIEVPASRKVKGSKALRAFAEREFANRSRTVDWHEKGAYRLTSTGVNQV